MDTQSDEKLLADWLEIVAQGENYQRVAQLLRHPNLKYLIDTEEIKYKMAMSRLVGMRKRLEDGEELNEEELVYLEEIEVHIKNVDPRIEKMFIAGEWVDVFRPIK
jgi:hypothetical protein